MWHAATLRRPWLTQIFALALLTGILHPSTDIEFLYHHHLSTVAEDFFWRHIELPCALTAARTLSTHQSSMEIAVPTLPRLALPASPPKDASGRLLSTQQEYQQLLYDSCIHPMKSSNSSSLLTMAGHHFDGRSHCSIAAEKVASKYRKLQHLNSCVWLSLITGVSL